MRQDSGIFETTCIKKQVKGKNRKYRAGITPGMNRKTGKKDSLEEKTGNIKNSGTQTRNKYYVCILFNN